LPFLFQKIPKTTFFQKNSKSFHFSKKFPLERFSFFQKFAVVKKNHFFQKFTIGKFLKKN